MDSSLDNRWLLFNIINLILLGSSLAALFYAIYFRSRTIGKQIFVPIIIYTAAVSIQSSWGQYEAVFVGINRLDSEDHSIMTSNLFMLIEFFVFAYILRSIIKTNIFRSILTIALIGFPIYSIVFWINNSTLSSNPYELSVVEFVILIPLYFAFFMEGLNHSKMEMSSENSYFWLATGILCYLITLLPNFIFLQTLRDLDFAYFDFLVAANLFISTGLNFVFIKALSCNTNTVSYQ